MACLDFIIRYQPKYWSNRRYTPSFSHNVILSQLAFCITLYR